MIYACLWLFTGLMSKRFQQTILILLVLQFFLAGAATADDQPVLYRAVTVGESRMLTEPGSWGETVMYVKKGRHVDILEVLPNFVYIRTEHRLGYLYRSRVMNVRAVDPVNTPPFGVIVYGYMAKADGDAFVLAAPDNGAEVLATLHNGARLAIIGFENGWGKVIYKRQYGYINPASLRDMMTVKSAPDENSFRAPLAVYTTYYKTTDSDTNIGRMQNIQLACEKLSAITLQPGQKLDFNRDIGPYNEENGYHIAPILADGKLRLNYGGGTCQVSSTLYNVLLQLPGITVIKRRAHGANGASYLPHGVDAAVGNSALNLIYRNDYDFPIRVDASSQDGALYISMWREEDLQQELEMRRISTPPSVTEPDNEETEADIEVPDIQSEFPEPAEDDLDPADEESSEKPPFQWKTIE